MPYKRKTVKIHLDGNKDHYYEVREGVDPYNCTYTNESIEIQEIEEWTHNNYVIVKGKDTTYLAKKEAIKLANAILKLTGGVIK
jgi:hypothetical protein